LGAPWRCGGGCRGEMGGGGGGGGGGSDPGGGRSGQVMTPHQDIGFSSFPWTCTKERIGGGGGSKAYSLAFFFDGEKIYKTRKREGFRAKETAPHSRLPSSGPPKGLPRFVNRQTGCSFLSHSSRGTIYAAQYMRGKIEATKKKTPAKDALALSSSISMATLGSLNTFPVGSFTAKSSRRFLLGSSIVPICAGQRRQDTTHKRAR